MQVKKFLFSVFVGLFLFVVAKPTFADIEGLDPTTVTNPVEEIQSYNEGQVVAAEGKPNLANTVGSFLDNFLAGTSEILLPLPNGSVKPNGKLRTDSAYSTGTKMIAMTYQNQPASVTTYVADVFRDMSINVSRPAYAQGLGFASLDPILNIWKTFRDLAYLGFVLIFIVIGFMMMFRQKVGSQSVVTVQQALPNIVIALLTVTFSYAIAGLLIDGMYLVMTLMVALFSAKLTPDFPYLSGTIVNLLGFLLGNNNLGSVHEVVSGFVTSAFGDNILTDLAGGGLSLAATVIFAVVIVFQIFKLFFGLVKTYVEIVLSIAFAPVILMMGALPGNNAFRDWIRNLVGNLAVFPAILLFLIVFSILKDATQGTSSNPSGMIPQAYAQGAFMPPYIVSGGGSAAQYLAFIVAMGLLMALGSLPEEVKKAMGVKGGGIFQTMAEKGFQNFNKSRKYGIGATSIAAGAGAGFGLGGLAGFARGRGNILQRSGNALKGAGLGLGLGAVSGGVAATGLPVKIIKSVGQSINRQVGDIITLNTVGAQMNKFARVQAAQAAARIKKLAGNQKSAMSQNIGYTPPPEGAPAGTLPTLNVPTVPVAGLAPLSSAANSGDDGF